METRSKPATVGKTAGLSAKKTGVASGHVFFSDKEETTVGTQSGLGKLTGRGVKRRASK